MVLGIVFLAMGLLAILDAVFQFAAKAFGLVTIVQGHVVADQNQTVATILRVVEFVIGAGFVVGAVMKFAGNF